MAVRRRLLVVTDWECSKYSALKRGLAYAPFFESHSRWSATFVDRQTLHTPPAQERRWRRATRRLSDRVARGLGQDAANTFRDDDIVRLAGSFDLVYLLKTPTAHLQQRILALNGPRVVVDMNDALWLPYHAGFGFSQLHDMLRTAHGVICENQYGAAYVQNHNQLVRIVPDCTQLETFDAFRNAIHRQQSAVRLGWIGSHSTAGSLYKIWEPLEDLFRRHSHLELRLVGAAAEHIPHFERVRWSSVLHYDREQMVREALAMDIGLFPMFRVEDSLARGNGKAVVYMAAGAVAACSNIGEHTRLIQDGVNGVLADSADEWLAKLDDLVTHPDKRYRIGQAGLTTVRSELSDQVCFQQLVEALDCVMDSTIDRTEAPAPTAS